MAFKLTILGSGSAVPTKNRQLSAHLLEKDGRSYLIDCAEGTQFQLLKYKKKLNKIDFIFISHLHGDHFYGIFGLISTMSMLGREKDLNIYAPDELKNLIEFHHKIENRILSFKLNFISLNFSNSEVLYKDNSIQITSFPMKHSVSVCGFRFDELWGDLNINKEFVEKHKVPYNWIVSIKKGGDYKDINGELFKNEDITYRSKKTVSYAYCSDTEYFSDIVNEIKNVDTLYHEATFLKIDSDNAKLKQHSTSIDAALIASQANAKRLILGHFSSRYTDVIQFKSEASEVYKDDILLAEDGLVVEF